MTQPPRIKKWLLRTGIVLLCMILILLAAAGAHYLIAQQKLKSVYAHMREDSIPLTWEELYQLYPITEAQRTAQLQLFALLDNLWDRALQANEQRGDRSFPRPPELGRTVTPATLKKMADHLHYVAPALEDVRRAVATEPFWFVPPIDSHDRPLRSHIIEGRNAARLFNIASVLHAERNKPKEAAQSVIDGIRLAEVPHRTFGILGLFARVMYESIALQSLEYVLAKTDPPQQFLHDLQTLFSTESSMRTALLGEVIATRELYAELSEESWSEFKEGFDLFKTAPWKEYVLAWPPIYTSWIRMNEAYNLELLHRVVYNWDLPWQEFNNRYMQTYDSIPWPYYLTAVYGIVDPKLKITELRAAGCWACGRIAIAIELYSQEHGKLPATLADLVPEYLDNVPTEPFYEKPFVYETDGNTGTLSFAIPDMKRDYIFKVFANRESIKLEGQ